MSAAFMGAITDPNRRPVADWCAEHVKLTYGSPKSSSYAPEMTPWVREPLGEIFDNANEEIVLRAPVGSGKSTLIEAVTAYIVAEDPGPTLITGQTDDDIEYWASTRCWKVLRDSAPTAGLMPKQRGKVAKGEIHFPHMDISLTGANMSGLQSKSIRWLLGDEVWLWKPGMLAEFRERMHRRWNGRRVITGQAGVDGDDYSVAWAESEQREWCFRCLKCKDVQPFRRQQLQYPDEGTDYERASAVEYVCGNCGTVWGDTIKDRRRLCEASRYEKMTEGSEPGRIGFHYNVLTLWDAPWRKFVMKWIAANRQAKRGIFLPLRQVIQKELAEDWEDDMTISRPKLRVMDKTVEDFAEGQKLEGEAKRFVTVDVQRDHYWVLIRAWRGDGSSVALWYGRINTEETIAELVSRYGVEPGHVYIDTGYDTGRIYDIICRYGWCGIRGDQATKFTHLAKRKRAKVERLYSPIKRALAPCGKHARYFFAAVDEIKDITAKLRGGEGAEWEVLEGLHGSYAVQLDSEAREEFLSPKTNQAQSRWVKKKRDNHSWDCEVYQTTAALVWGIFGE